MANKYAEALAAFLQSTGTSQAKFAELIGCSQPHVFHFSKGTRFPRKEMARKIELATDGRVPINLWQITAIDRAGIY